MAISFNDNLELRAPKLIDNRSAVFENGRVRPYNSLEEAYEKIPTSLRALGLNIYVRTPENGLQQYWFRYEGDPNIDPVLRLYPVAEISGEEFHVLGARLSKQDWNLDKVDNTSDMEKPVSVAQEAAIENMGERVASSITPIVVTGTVLPRGANIPSRVIIDNQVDLYGAGDTESTIYTNTGTTPAVIEVAAGFMQPVLYNKETDSWRINGPTVRVRGDKGDKGDPFLYEDLTSAQLLDLVAQINVNAQRIPAVAPGVLPAGPTGESRYMEVTAVGTWTYGGVDIGSNTEGFKTTFWWNGTAWSNNGSVKVKGDPIPTVDNLTSTSIVDGLSANQGRILNEKIEGSKSVDITGYSSGYVNASGAINASSSYRNSGFTPVTEGKTYVALVSGTSSVMVLSAYSSASQGSFLNIPSFNKMGTTPVGTTPVEITFTVPVGSGITNIKLCSQTAISTLDLYLIELDNSGIKARILKTENSVSTLDETVFGNESSLNIPSWESGYIDASGAIIASGSYFNSAFTPVTPGIYEVRVSGTATVMVVSSYASANQASFVPGAISNIMGTAPSGNIPTVFTVEVPTGVNFIKTVRHSSIPESDVYIKRLDDDSLVYRVTELEKNSGSAVNSMNIVNATKIRFNNRDKAVFCWIWDDLNDTDELVFNIFQEYGFVPNFALTSNNLNSGNVDLYKRVYEAGGSILSHDTGSTINAASIQNSKSSIEDYGFKVNGYVTPGSVLDVSLLPIAKKVYGYAYTKNPPNKGVFPTAGFDNAVDVGELSRIGIETWNVDETNQAQLKSLIDWAITNNKKVSLYGHKLPSTYLNSDGVTTRFSESDLRGILTYIKTKVDSGDCLFVSSDEFMFQVYK